MQTNNKLREALKDIGRLVEQIHFLYSDYPSEIHEIARKVNAALAEPVKNCEVGTADEQKKRFSDFCCSHTDPTDIDGWVCDKRCPLYEKHPKCKEAWEQMPYEEGGDK